MDIRPSKTSPAQFETKNAEAVDTGPETRNNATQTPNPKWNSAPNKPSNPDPYSPEYENPYTLRRTRVLVRAFTRVLVTVQGGIVTAAHTASHHSIGLLQAGSTNQSRIQYTYDPKPYRIVGYDPLIKGSNP